MGYKEIRSPANTSLKDLRDVCVSLLLSLFPLPDFGIAGHFINRVVDVHCVLDHCAILKHLDLLGHTSDGKVVTVTVKLNTETQGSIVHGRMEIILIEMLLCHSLLQ